MGVRFTTEFTTDKEIEEKAMDLINSFVDKFVDEVKSTNTDARLLTIFSYPVIVMMVTSLFFKNYGLSINEKYSVSITSICNTINCLASKISKSGCDSKKSFILDMIDNIRDNCIMALDESSER